MPVTESAVVGIVLRDEALAVFGSDQVASVEPLRPRPLGATVGVWRVRVADRSAVLKLLRLGAGSNINWAASPEPDHPRWWRRELVVLRDDLVDVLRPDSVLPRSCTLLTGRTDRWHCGWKTSGSRRRGLSRH